MCCGKFVGTWDAIWLAIEYDVEIVIPFLMVCFEWLNPTSINASNANVVDVGEDFEKKYVWCGGFH